MLCTDFGKYNLSVKNLETPAEQLRCNDTPEIAPVFDGQ